MEGRREGVISVADEKEKGDIQLSLQRLVENQYITKVFKQVLGATRLTRRDIITIALMEPQRITMKMLSTTKADLEDKTLSDEERQELRELYAIKIRIMKNPCALAYIMYQTTELPYIIGLQSHEGLSRREAIEIVMGSHRRIMDPEQLGFFGRTKRRLFGNVLFPE